MKKCKMTASGKHIWVLELLPTGWGVKPTGFSFCHACHVFDDRPPRKEKNKV